MSRWIRLAARPHDPAKRWLTFLRNHREAIAAMYYFTVLTLTFGILYCFFIISHDRRRIVHHNVTRNPNALWVRLQVYQAWECGEQPLRFLIFDRDTKFGGDVVSTVKAIASQPIRTTYRSPWQNGIAERWVGSLRRELLDHLIVLNRRHLRRLLNEYIRYYHEDLNSPRTWKRHSWWSNSSLSTFEWLQCCLLPRLGGLHHRYTAAA